jgi:hypothetical protein
MHPITNRSRAGQRARAVLTTVFTLCSIQGCMAATDSTADELAGQPQLLAARVPAIGGAIPISCPIFSTCFTVINTNDTGAGSLRQAILDANATAGNKVIDFDIPGAGKKLIRPLTTLPAVQGPTVIDGTSQPTAVAATETTPSDLKIVLDGEACQPDCEGLVLEVGGNVVRGMVINDFEWHGVVAYSDGNIVEGNIVGTGPDQLISVPNGVTGVYVIGDGNLVGGTMPADRNVIAGNGGYGVIMFGDENELYGNSIGVNYDGSLALGNDATGVVIYGSNNEIGGTEEGQANHIANNGGDGIALADGEANTFALNAIHYNGQLAIDLAADEVTLNDGLGDADVGPNGLQNFPHVNAITLDPATFVPDAGYKAEVDWQLKSEPSTKYRIEFYASSSCDPSGRGEAQRFLGSRAHDTDTTGLIEHAWIIPGRVQDGEYVTMLATKLRDDGSSYVAEDSSELGRCHQALL